VHSKSLLGVLDSPLDAALIALLALSYVTPLILIVILLLKRGNWRPNIPDWRWRLWNGGLALGGLASVAIPIFLLGLQFLSSTAKQRWFIDGGSEGMFIAFLLAPIAVILTGFGGGRQRWMGMLSGALSFVVLYISLLAASS